MAYDVPDGGNATLAYSTALTRRLAIALQVVAWLLVGLATSRWRGWRRWLVRRRRRGIDPVAPMISFEPGSEGLA